MDDIVHDDRNGLRSRKVKIGVAKTTDIETRRRTAVGAFDEQARDMGRQRGDIGTGVEDAAGRVGRQGGGGHRHLLQVFLAAVGGHDDHVELAVIGLFGTGCFGVGAVDVLRQSGLRECEGQRAGREKAESKGAVNHGDDPFGPALAGAGWWDGERELTGRH